MPVNDRTAALAREALAMGANPTDVHTLSRGTAGLAEDEMADVPGTPVPAGGEAPDGFQEPAPEEAPAPLPDEAPAASEGGDGAAPEAPAADPGDELLPTRHDPGIIATIPGEQIDTPNELRIKQQDRLPTNQELGEAAATDPSHSFLALLSMAAENDSTLSAFSRRNAGDKFQHDPEFDSVAAFQAPETLERIRRLLPTADIETLGRELGESVSAEHFEHQLANFESYLEREKAMTDQMGKALVARMIIGAIDPVDLGVMAVTGGFGASAKVGRIANALRVGVSAGMANASVEGVVAVDNPFRGQNEVMMAAILGIALGGTIGGITARTQLDDAARRSLNGLVDSVGSARRIMRVDDADAPWPAGPLAPRSQVKLLEIAGFDTAPGQFRFEKLQKAQFNYQGRLFFSDDEEVRTIASRMIEGGFLKNRDEARAFTAELQAQQINGVFMTGFMRDTGDAFKRWSKRNGIGHFRATYGTKASEDFYSEVGLAMRGVTNNVSAEASEAARAVRPLMDDLYQIAREAGVKGFEKDKLDHFFPRMYHREKWLGVMRDVPEENVINWFKHAIMGEAADMPEELAEKLGKWYVRGITRRSGGMDANVAHGIDLDDMGKLRELLQENIDPASMKTVDDLVDEIDAWKSARKPDSGSVTHARQRIRIDETYRAPVEKKDKTVMDLGLSDLTENNAFKVLHRYSRVMSGHIGLAGRTGIKSRADFEAIKKGILDRGVEKGRTNSAMDEVEALDDAYKLLTGTSVEENPFGKASMAARSITSLNYTRFSGGFGVSQIPEVGNVVGEAGVLYFLKNIPALRGMLTRGQDGKLVKQLGRDLEDAFAPGTDFMRNPAVAAFDDFGNGFDESALGGILRKIDPALQSMGRLSSVVSFMAPLNAALQRSASINWSAKMYRRAMHGKHLGADDVRRMRSGGWDEATQAKVFEGLKQFGKKGRNGELEGIDFQAWRSADPVTASAFELAGYRASRQLIQENNIGNTGRAIHRPVGKIVFQFMSFMFNSINKQMLHGVHHADIQTWVSWSTASFFGAMAYTGQTMANFWNDEEQLEKRLTPQRIAAAGFARAGFAAALVPVVDNAMALGQLDPIFAYSRPSGLGTTIAGSNPTMVTLRDVWKAASALSSPLHEDAKFTRQHVGSIMRLSPFHRVLGVQSGFNALGNMVDE